METGRVLVVVRHGRTEWNAAGRYQGHADPPMDAMGLEQADRAAAAVAELRAEGRLGPARPLLITSDMQRAVRTADVLARALGVPYAVHDDLREVDLGSWSGLTRAEAEARFPGEFAAWSAGTDGAPGATGTRLDVRRGGGETAAEAGQRVAERIGSTLHQAGDASVVVVGHGTSLQAALTILREAGVVEFRGPVPHLHNGEVLVLRAPGRIPGSSRPLGAAPSI